MAHNVLQAESQSNPRTPPVPPFSQRSHSLSSLFLVQCQNRVVVTWIVPNVLVVHNGISPISVSPSWATAKISSLLSNNLAE